MPRDTAGERVIPDLLLPMFSNPSVLRTPPLYFALQNTGEEDNSFLYFSFWGSPDEQGERLDENSGSLKREEGGKNNFTKEGGCVKTQFLKI
mgnify:FL=1